jgi:Uncharacterized protein, possibly involved in utilization of glycolate and propanediol
MTTHLLVPTVNYETATRIVAAAMQLATDAGVRGVVSVVDPAMQLIAFGRADGATPHSVETSRRKADTAASTRWPSSAMRPELSIALEHGSGGRLTSIAGGVPLAFNGVHVGGLGVAGGTPEQDAEIAVSTLALIEADAAVTS